MDGGGLKAMMQVTAGDVRLMVPCCKAATAGSAAAFGQTASAFDETATTVGDSEPSFLVLILSGFIVSSQAEDQRPSPRLTRSFTLGQSGTVLPRTSLPRGLCPLSHILDADSAG